MSSSGRFLVLAIVAVLAAPVTALAQGGTAALGGTITDESKAVLPGATVTATDLSTGRTYSAVSDERGEYRMANMTPGTYRVQAELTGFSTVVNPSVELLVGQNAV